MPSTYREKVIAAVGFGAVLLLALVALVGGNSSDGAEPIANSPAAAPGGDCTRDNDDTSSSPATTTGRQPQPGDVTLVVTASRGESLVAVRIDSEDGESLFEGFSPRAGRSGGSAHDSGSG